MFKGFLGAVSALAILAGAHAAQAAEPLKIGFMATLEGTSVSYTHLTLPTILPV